MRVDQFAITRPKRKSREPSAYDNGGPPIGVLQRLLDLGEMLFETNVDDAVDEILLQRGEVAGFVEANSATRGSGGNASEITKRILDGSGLG